MCGAEIANNIHAFKVALSRSGMDVDACCFVHNAYYAGNSYEYSTEAPVAIKSARIRSYFSLFLRAWFFFTTLRRYDAYIYVWRESFLPLKLDYLILRLLGRKTVVFHCGDDVRYRPVQSKIDRFIYNVHYFSPENHELIRKYEASGSSFAKAFWSQRFAEAFGVALVSMRSHATFQSKPAFFFRFPQSALLSSPKKARDIPLIVHAPTDRIGKGTDYVLKAIEKLKKSGREFDFEIIENKPNSYLLQRLKDADILVDQPGPWFGKLGVEALASSCVVFSGNMYSYYGIADESPVIQFNPDDEYLYDQLVKVVDDKFFREKLMCDGFNYWSAVYSEKAFSGYVENILNGGRNGLFVPIDNCKSILMQYADGFWRRLVIRFFYSV